MSKTTFCTSPCRVHSYLRLLFLWWDSFAANSNGRRICSLDFLNFFLSSKICFYTLCFCFPTLIVHFPTKLLGHPSPPPPPYQKKEKSHENAPLMIMFEIQRLLLLIRVCRYENVIQYNNNFIIKFITF